MAGAHEQELAAFAADKRFRGKGPLCVALVVTQHAKTMGLPLDPNELLTEGGGQVLGLGKGAVQAVLKRHGITRGLADEGAHFTWQFEEHARVRRLPEQAAQQRRCRS